jgi:hypothetical protein
VLRIIEGQDEHEEPFRSPPVHCPRGMRLPQPEDEMAGIVMWLMGVPLVVIVLLYLIF